MVFNTRFLLKKITGVVLKMKKHFPSNSIQLCHQLFEEKALQLPTAIAAQYQGVSITYQVLNQRANQLARHLQQVGVGPNVPVGLCLARSLDTLVAMLGILKAGGAYVPLDPSYPLERLGFMLKNAQAPVLITQQDLANHFVLDEQIVFCIDTDWVVVKHQDDTNLECAIADTDLAYIVYTSGSTGQPKGVAMPHRPLTNLIHWQNAQSQGKSSPSLPERTLQFTPMSFDVSFQEIFATLSTGGMLVLIGDHERRDPDYLCKVLVEEQVNRLFLPFVALNQLAEAIASSGNIPTTLREVITAGEQLRITPAIASWFQKMPHCTLTNHYGPAESHVVTAYTLTGDPETWPQLPPIGTPIANVELQIRHPETQEFVAAGEPGELYIGGVSLAQGYLHRPDLTAARFVSHLSTTGRDRLYKTGDLVRLLPDGNLEYLGRADQQVKVCGVRVEPGEIEAVLEQHPAVQQAVVVLREDVPGDQRLVAYAIGSVAESEETVRQFLQAQLPACMVPSTIVWLPELPLTPSGKVDRRSLPQPEYSRASLDNKFAAPRIITEQILADLWQSILSINEIGIYDNFFELGGNSLKAIQLVHRIRDAFQIDLPMLALFDAPTIQQLSQVVETMLDSGRLTTTDDITVAELLNEAELATDIQVNPSAIAPVLNPRHVLITGVTGFLGAFLLVEILEQTHANVHCLVRAQDALKGWVKIRNNLEKYRLWQEDYADRILPVVGDLAQPRLGLTVTEFDDLAKTVEVIYHSGAAISLIHPYADLRDANVAGTEELLRLATQGWVKPFHFISTLDVFQTSRAFSSEPIAEHDALDASEAVFFDGYTKSKWVSEQMVEEARSRGLPACIYRPAMITGHRKSGAANTDDLMNRLIKGFIELGAAPDFDMVFNVAPVDHFSKSTVYLSLQPESLGQNFNCINPNPVSMRRFVAVLNECGYAVESVDHATWEELLSEHVESLDGIVHVLTSKVKAESWSYIERSSVGADQVSCENVLTGLQESTIACPEITAEMLRPYFAFFAEVGFLALPDTKVMLTR